MPREIDVEYNPPTWSRPVESWEAWAVCLAIVLNHHYHEDWDPAYIASRWGYDVGNQPGFEVWLEVARQWELATHHPPGDDIQEWAELLRNNGPIWLCQINGSHPVVLTGLRGDGTWDETRVKVIDPWSGPSIETYDNFVKLFDRIGAAADGGNLYLIHR